jgi:hypothetical protein
MADIPSMLTDPACSALHVNIALWPFWIIAGEAENVRAEQVWESLQPVVF